MIGDVRQIEMKAAIRHAIGYTMCYGLVFAVFLTAIACSWPIPGGDVTHQGRDLVLANIGSSILSFSVIPFLPVMSFFGVAFWFFVTAVWAGLVYSLLILVWLVFRKTRKTAPAGSAKPTPPGT